MLFASGAAIMLVICRFGEAKAFGTWQLIGNIVEEKRMAFTKYVMIECDHCGCCDYATTGSIAEARKHAITTGFVARKGKIFCDEECAAAFGAERATGDSPN